MHLKRLIISWTCQLFFPGTVLRRQYQAFKSLLNSDKQAHRLIAELEEVYHSRINVDLSAVEKTYLKLSDCVARIITDLLTFSPLRYKNLESYLKKFDDYIRLMLEPPAINTNPPYTLFPDDITIDNQDLVGGKAFNLARVKGALQMPIPDGFVITTRAFYYFIEENQLRDPIKEILSDLDIGSFKALKDASRRISDLIRNSRVPEPVMDNIRASLSRVSSNSTKEPRFAVRSSAVGEDSAISFAGQYRSILGVKNDELAEAYKKVIAGKYSSRSLFYRIHYGFADTETPMAVLILKMVSAEVSGIIYTCDPESKEPETILIHSIFGLGEILASGKANPDIVKVSRLPGHPILSRTNGVKTEKLIFSPQQALETVAIPAEQQQQPSLDDDRVKTLASWAEKLEKFYGAPQDVEWCKDSRGDLFLLQSRPLVTRERSAHELSCDFEAIPNKILLSGEKASSGIVSGKVCKVERDADLEFLAPESILVARNALPHYVAVLGKLAGVVTDQGSKAGHFPSVAREFGIPVLVNTQHATKTLKNGMEITIHADRNIVFEGAIPNGPYKRKANENPLHDNPYKRRMKFIISFISPLQLTDPQSSTFRPEGCRSLHDIIRYSHEMALREMFNIGDKRSARIRSAKMLKTEIPISFYLLDIGKGLIQGAVNAKRVTLSDVRCFPLKHLFKGLTHPDIRWSKFSHFNWEEFDNIVMSGGMISKSSAHLASYAMVSDDYLNLNLRFGYHFVIVDCLCTNQVEKNHLTFRFTGGGGTPEGKVARTQFLNSILQRLGFKVNSKGELVDAQLKEVDLKTLEKTLDMIGRLLGATRLMDMYLKDISMAEIAANEFMKGRYDFTSTSDFNNASDKHQKP